MPRRTPSDPAHYALENSIGYLLNRAAHLIAARFSDDLKPFDVNLQSWRVLTALRAQDNQSMSELADHTGAELSYLYRSVVAMEARGLLLRTPSPTDKRTIHLSLTDAGLALVQELSPKAKAIERLSVHTVSAEHLAITLSTLRTVCHHLVNAPGAPDAVNRKLTVARRVKKKAEARPDETAPRRTRA